MKRTNATYPASSVACSASWKPNRPAACRFPDCQCATPNATLAAIAPDTEAVYYGPTTNLNTDQFTALAAAVNARRLPSFSMIGPEDVKDGALATLVPEGELRRLARRVANYLQRIIVMGVQAKDLAVEFKTGEALTLNMETARTIGYSPTWKLSAEADLINEEAAAVAREARSVTRPCTRLCASPPSGMVSCLPVSREAVSPRV